MILPAQELLEMSQHEFRDPLQDTLRQVKEGKEPFQSLKRLPIGTFRSNDTGFKQTQLPGSGLVCSKKEHDYPDADFRHRCADVHYCHTTSGNR